MSYLGSTLVLYFLIGLGVAAAAYLTVPANRWPSALLAWPFWPIYLPLLLAPGRANAVRPHCEDEMLTAIAQVEAELEAALASLNGWADDVLAREKTRLTVLRSVWQAHAERIREMDHVLSRPEYASPIPELPSSVASERVRQSREARQQNLERLRQFRRRAYDDFMGSLAWVRELVSMVHLAKFTGAPASRAEELISQIAAAVEGLSEATWEEATAPVNATQPFSRDAQRSAGVAPRSAARRG